MGTAEEKNLERKIRIVKLLCESLVDEVADVVKTFPRDTYKVIYTGESIDRLYNVELKFVCFQNIKKKDWNKGTKIFSGEYVSDILRGKPSFSVEFVRRVFLGDQLILIMKNFTDIVKDADSNILTAEKLDLYSK